MSPLSQFDRDGLLSSGMGTNPFDSKTVAMDVAARVRAKRLELKWSQVELAFQAGVAIETYRAFERTGAISLERLARVLNALGLLAEIERLGTGTPYIAAGVVLSASGRGRYFRPRVRKERVKGRTSESVRRASKK